MKTRTLSGEGITRLTIPTSIATLAIGGTLLAVLVGAFQLYAFGYFYTDDFVNLAFAQLCDAPTLVRANLRPASSTFRPMGTTAYWVMLHWAGLNPMPYRVVTWILYTINVLMVFLFLKDASRSAYAAAFGVLFFSFQMATSDVLFSFATIFDLLAGFWFFCGLLIYTRYSHTWGGGNLSSPDLFPWVQHQGNGYYHAGYLGFIRAVDTPAQ